MRVKLLGSLIIIFSSMLYLMACDNNVSPGLEDSFELFTGLQEIPEAEATRLVINHGTSRDTDSFFHIEISGAKSNPFINNGATEAWCLEWKKPLRSNNDIHDGVKWYATSGNDKWLPLNYLFSIRGELQKEDPTLTYREIQAVVWALAGYMKISPEFDVDKISNSEMPRRLMEDGVPAFNKEKVKTITSRVLREYPQIKELSPAERSIPFGAVAETEHDEQDVFVPGVPSDPCDEDAIDFDKVDVMLLFDDTGSFAGRVPTIVDLFPDIIAELESTFPAKEFAFGVSRFEDYGGPGTGFSGEVSSGRPFLLNQPLVTQGAAGGAAARNTLIQDALGRTAPGFGGDGPETAIHALYELATGNGFDGDGDGSTTGSGVAGSLSSQTSPGNTGDVPAFSTNILPTSGTLGGAGWRTDAQKIVIIATDVCSVTSFDPASGIPAEVTGQPGTSEVISKFACSSTTAGVSRFGFVSDAKSSGANTVSGAVAPSGSPDLQDAIDALTSFGIQVIGLSTTAPNPAQTGPSSSPHVFLGAMANLTGAVDGEGNPLVFQIGAGGAAIAAGIVDAVGTSACDAATATTAKLAKFSESLRSMATSTSDDDTTRYSNYVIFE
jgi:hypothetical protein